MKQLTAIFLLLIAFISTSCQEDPMPAADLQLFSVEKVTNDLRLIATLPTVTTGYKQIEFYVSTSGSYPECGAGTLVGSVTDFSTPTVEVLHENVLSNSSTLYQYRVCVKTTDNNYDSSYTAEYNDNVAPFASVESGALRINDNEVFEVTAEKVFFSYDRDEFVRADELGLGEEILITVEDHEEIVKVTGEFIYL